MTTAQMNDPERDGVAAVGIPVDRRVRPRAWADDKVMAGQVGNCASDAAKTYWQRSNQFDRMMAERLTHPLYAMPPELADYLLRHLLRERAALDGFLRLGNEKSRAKRLDAWIACLAGPNVGAMRRDAAGGTSV